MQHTKKWIEPTIYGIALLLVAGAFFVEWVKGSNRDWILSTLLGLSIIILTMLLTERYGVLRRIESAIESSGTTVHFFSDTLAAPPFAEYMRSVSQEMLLVGPSRTELIRQNQKNALMRLAEKAEVKILVTNPGSSAVAAIGRFSDPPLPDGRTQLELALESVAPFLKAWAEEAVTQGKNLKVKTYELIPFNISFYDPKTAHGKLLLITLPWQTAAQERPCIEIDRASNREVFDKLYDKYNYLFEKVAKPIQ